VIEWPCLAGATLTGRAIGGRLVAAGAHDGLANAVRGVISQWQVITPLSIGALERPTMRMAHCQRTHERRLLASVNLSMMRICPSDTLAPDDAERRDGGGYR